MLPMGNCANSGAWFPKLGLAALVLALAPRSFAASPAQISVPSQTTAPGSSIVLPVTFATADNIAGIQFDVEYDNTALSLVAIPGDAAKLARKGLYEADIAPNKRRFLILGFN